MSVEKMEKDLNRQLKAPAFPGSATKGTGVGDALKECVQLTLKALQKELQWAE